MTRRASGIVVLLCTAALLNVACRRDEYVFPTPAPTPVPLAVTLRDQAAPKCAAAFGAQATSGPVRAPMIAMKRYDESAVQERYRDGRMDAREWIAENGYNAAGNLHASTFLPTSLRATSVEDVQSLACVQERRVQVGTYQRTEWAAARIDWDVRLVRWPDGAVLGTMSFRGADPPESHSFQAGTAPCGSPGGLCGTVHGNSPQDAFEQWIQQTVPR
jgi:hypothetical protein